MTAIVLDLTGNVQLPGVVQFLFLFFWTVGLIFIVRALIKKSRRRR